MQENSLIAQRWSQAQGATATPGWTSSDHSRGAGAALLLCLEGWTKLARESKGKGNHQQRPRVIRV